MKERKRKQSDYIKKTSVSSDLTNCHEILIGYIFFLSRLVSLVSGIKGNNVSWFAPWASWVLVVPRGVGVSQGQTRGSIASGICGVDIRGHALRACESHEKSFESRDPLRSSLSPLPSMYRLISTVRSIREPSNATQLSELSHLYS